MIDIHTHILPGIDDGASDVSVSLKMLDSENADGVELVCLTPHFDSQKGNVDAFLEKRNKAYAVLCEALKDTEHPELLLGAEVRYSPMLTSQNPEKLTLGNSNYLLLELPFHHYPAHIEQIVRELESDGITPILAHVERYDFFRKQPDLLLSLIKAGAMGQVNMHSLTDRADKGFAMACLRNSLAHFVASDAHNTTDRAPCMGLLNDAVSAEMMSKLKTYSAAFRENEVQPFFNPTPVRKTLFGYK